MAFDKDIPDISNEVSSDIPAIKENWKYVVHGDGTAGRVMRRSMLLIEDGTAANSIKCTLSSEWNGDVIAAEDSITKGSGTSFGLSAGGGEITIEAAGLSGNAVAVLSAEVGHCSADMATDDKTWHMMGIVSANDIVLKFRAYNGNEIDLTSAVDLTEYLEIYITYLTSA